jgi:hypothetical protein
MSFKKDYKALVTKANNQGIKEGALPAPLLDCHECERISVLFEKCPECGASADKIGTNGARSRFECGKCNSKWEGFICPYCNTKNSATRAMRVSSLNYQFWHSGRNDAGAHVRYLIMLAVIVFSVYLLTT